MNVPDAVGVPLIVIVFDAHAGVTPAGNPVAVPIPVAPVVVCVMLVKAVLTHNVGVADAAVTVFGGDIASKIDVFLPLPLRVAEPAIFVKIEVVGNVAAAIPNFLLLPFTIS